MLCGCGFVAEGSCLSVNKLYTQGHGRMRMGVQRCTHAQLISSFLAGLFYLGTDSAAAVLTQGLARDYRLSSVQRVARERPQPAERAEGAPAMANSRVHHGRGKFLAVVPQSPDDRPTGQVRYALGAHLSIAEG